MAEVFPPDEGTKAAALGRRRLHEDLHRFAGTGFVGPHGPVDGFLACRPGRPGVPPPVEKRDEADDDQDADRQTREEDLPELELDRDLPLRGGLRPDGHRAGDRQALLDGLEVGEHIGRALVAALPRLLQALQDDPAQAGRDLGVERLGIGRRLAAVLEDDAERRLALEGDPARDHLEEHRPQGVDVGPAVDVAAVRLLRGHVLRRPDDDPGAGDAAGVERAGDAEVHDLGVAVLVDHDVLRLEVAVDDAQPVGLGQPFGDLPGQADGLGLVEVARPADEALEVLAGDVLHGDVDGQPLLADVVHPADVPVGDLAGQLDLVSEALDDLEVRGDLGLEELEGDDLADLAVVGLVDHAHAALADLLDDLEAAGERGAPLEAPRGGLESGRSRGDGVARGRELTAAAAAETGPLGILVLAARAFHRCGSGP